uniref:Uncharacterized protein n=1 Tax=Arundo donax TaxID=35708 RepID=A0A0A9BUU0_ARUDO
MYCILTVYKRNIKCATRI